MIPRIDLFHQLVYDDGDFVAIANHIDTPSQYSVYEKDTGEWIGGTNSEHWEAQVRVIIRYRIKWLQSKLNICE